MDFGIKYKMNTTVVPLKAFSEVDERILESVDCGLEALGKNVRHVVYYHVEKTFRLKKSDIPAKPEAFEQAIISIFGEKGAKTIEELIVQKMRKTFKLRRRSKQTFTNIVLEVRMPDEQP